MIAKAPNQNTRKDSELIKEREKGDRVFLVLDTFDIYIEVVSYLLCLSLLKHGGDANLPIDQHNVDLCCRAVRCLLIVKCGDI